MSIAKQLIHHEITLAIVKIFIYEEFQGTGFFISPHYLITAFHCIKNPPPSNIKIELTSAKKIAVQWVAEKSLTELDIAVLQIIGDYQSPYYLPLGLINQNHLGDEVISGGYPAYRADNQELGLYPGTISRFQGAHRFENDAAEGRGQSGAPVYHYKTQRVVGLVSLGYKAEIAKKAGLAVHFQQLFQHWQELTLINQQTIQNWQQRLQRRVLNDKITRFKQQLLKHIDEISEIWKTLTDYLKNLRQKFSLAPSDKAKLQTITDFLTHKIPATEFIHYWQAEENTPQAALNYALLAKRLKDNEIAIFLGSSLTEQLTPALAKLAHYPDFQGSFSQICQYLELHEDYSRPTLRQQIETLTNNITAFPERLYQLLAQLSTPLIIIFAGYDNKLETLFSQHQKKFVVLSHTAEHKIHVKYCDQAQPEKYTPEALSTLDLFEDNTDYSLIYKINGCLKLSVPKRINENDSLVLSEQDYFKFAHFQDQLIPDYLIGHLTGRDLWLLEQYQQSWETRFMIQAILDKRAKKSERSNAIIAIHQQTNQFDETYWKAKHVNNYRIDLEEFIDNLRAHL